MTSNRQLESVAEATNLWIADQHALQVSRDVIFSKESAKRRRTLMIEKTLPEAWSKFKTARSDFNIKLEPGSPEYKKAALRTNYRALSIAGLGRASFVWAGIAQSNDLGNALPKVNAIADDLAEGYFQKLANGKLELPNLGYITSTISEVINVYNLEGSSQDYSRIVPTYLGSLGIAAANIISIADADGSMYLPEPSPSESNPQL